MAVAVKNEEAPPTTKQWSHCLNLIATKVPDHATRASFLFSMAAMNRAQISSLIDALTKFPQLTAVGGAPAPASAAIPAGKYMFNGEAYTVKIGKQSGLNYLIGPDGAYLGVKGLAAEVLKGIAASPKTFAVAYGKATGVCGMCSATLTDPKSIEAGIGPTCGSKL